MWPNSANTPLFTIIILLNSAGKVNEKTKKINSPLHKAMADKNCGTAVRDWFKIGFDSCLVSGIAKFTDVLVCFYDYCDAGRFSIYVSEDMKAYPCSFMAQNYKGVSLRETTIKKVWIESLLFQNIRNIKIREECAKCAFLGRCKGGCPIFSEINVCVK